MAIPIVPPHELTTYLLGKGYIKFDASKARRHWDHLREHRVPWMTGAAAQSSEESTFEPLALYADGAEYTVSKEKILVVFCSCQIIYQNPVQLLCS